jgi:prepilin-type N-terminal cleavage/methylation domain-containing protein
MHIKQKQLGFSVIELLIVLAVLGVIGLIGFKVLSGNKKNDDTKAVDSQTQASPSETKDTGLIWQQSENGWRSTQAPPKCPDQPMLTAPVDLSKVTSVLYPGQTRGGNYKPHGGFRFDNSTDNKITVTAPIDGYLVRGGSYIAEGEVQYTFDAMNNCGVMYRIGHIRELPANLQKIADTWPKPTSSSATQPIGQNVVVKQGDVLATKVGILSENNTFFDWGVYDYRQENEASKSQAYKTNHPMGELTWHAVCWLDGWLPGSDQATLKALPAGDPASGKNSDYCK